MHVGVINFYEWMTGKLLVRGTCTSMRGPTAAIIACACVKTAPVAHYQLYAYHDRLELWMWYMPHCISANSHTLTAKVRCKLVAT